MIIFRVDGNPDIGMGHIMRCLSLADAGRKLNENSLFAVADNHFSDTIKKQGHKVSFLNTNYKNMLSDLDMMNELIKRHKPVALFIDSYQVSYTYMYALWETCKTVECKLIYIDDILAFAYPCDILLNYNIYGSDKENEYRSLYQNKGISCPYLLLGMRYVPLRQEFQHMKKRIVKKQAENILVSTGGADPDHIAKNLVQYIVNNNTIFQYFCFHFVIGIMNTDRLKIEKLAAQNETIVLHHNVQHMKQLMCNADVAISAAGSTLYELCATQTPTITYILAENQVLGAEKFDENKILHCVGDIRDLKERLIKELLKNAISLAKDYKERVRIAERQCLLIDGNGAKRVMEEACRGYRYV